MKLLPRKSEKTILANRITAPETRKEPESGQRTLLLGFIDESGNQRHAPTSRELFLHAAGRNVEGQVPDGLDRLSNTKFIIHMGKEGEALGIDIIPSRVYRSNVIPTSQANVEAVRLIWRVDGAVCEVTQRPPNTRPKQLIALMRGLEKLAKAGTKLVVGTVIPEIGVVVSVGLDTADIRLNTGAAGGRPIYQNVEGDDDDDN